MSQLADDQTVVQRILGTSEDMGKLLGLDKDWAYRAIKAAGSYGEIFERNVGPNAVLKLPRGANNLWSKGGLLYAPPIRSRSCPSSTCSWSGAKSTGLP